MTVIQRTCVVCNSTKDIDEFYKTKARGQSFRHAKCKTCYNKKRKEAREPTRKLLKLEIELDSDALDRVKLMLINKTKKMTTIAEEFGISYQTLLYYYYHRIKYTPNRNNPEVEAEEVAETPSELVE